MGLTTRALEPDDLDAVIALAQAYDRRWFGEPLLSAADIRGIWADPAFDLWRDAEGWVEGDGRLQAYGVLHPWGVIEVAVADDWRGAGLEDVLTSRWEDEARRRRKGVVYRDVPDADRETAAALLARGYVLDFTGWTLALDPATVLDRRDDVDGYTVREATEADAAAAYRLIEDAFSEWRSQTRSYASWRASLWDRPDLVADHCRVMTYAGALVGACLVLDPPDDPAVRPEAWVPQLAVERQHRGRGLARRLLTEVAAAARGRGVPYLGLSTDTRTGALGLYESLGMTVRHTVHTYALELDADLSP